MKRSVLGIVCLMYAITLTGCIQPIEKVPNNENVINLSLEDVQSGTTATETVKTTETNETKTTTESNTTEKMTTTQTSTTEQPQTSEISTTTTNSETTAVIETTIAQIQIDTIAETTILSTVTTVNEVPVQNKGIQDLPWAMQQYVNTCLSNYPGLHIGCGVFSLDGTCGYGYNLNEEIYSACTIKAPYAMYVLKECEKQGLNIWETKIMYTKSMYNSGSGVIKDGPVNTEYSIGYLLSVLLKVSDNTAYNVLVSRFGLYGYQQYLNQIGGQNLYGSQYGRASAQQRLNEWAEIIKYIGSGSVYAQVLKSDITGRRTYNPAIGTMQIDPNGSQYCYLAEWMKHDHEYMHKSGWSWGDYMSACDCAVIDNQYIIIMMTADYATGLSRIDILRGFGSTVEAYVDSVGGTQYLFS